MILSRFRAIGKLFAGSGNRAFACHRAVILLGTASVRALGAHTELWNSGTPGTLTALRFFPRSTRSPGPKDATTDVVNGDDAESPQ